jgi:hypothetical protein
MALIIRWEVEFAYLDLAEPAHLLSQVPKIVTVDIPNATTEQSQPAAAFTAALALIPTNTVVDPIGGGNVNRQHRMVRMTRLGQFTV